MVRRVYVVSVVLAIVVGSACVRDPEPANPVPAGKLDADGMYALGVATELADKLYAGRQVGSAGGRLAGDRLLAELEAIGLEARAQEFAWRTAMNEGPAILELRREDGEPARVYEYRRDFREAVRGAYEGGQAEGPLFVMEDSRASFPAGAVLLLSKEAYNPNVTDRYLEGGAAGFLVEVGDQYMPQRPLFAGQAPGTLPEPQSGLPLLALSSSCYRELALAAASGASVVMRSPVRFRDVTARNLVGLWDGDGGGCAPTVMVMAHYDHVGHDADGSVFPGALDNASGVGVALAVAKAWTALGMAADFCVLLSDAEETGLAGAGYFAAHPPFSLAGVRVLNVDMAGSVTDMAVSVLAGDRELARRVADALGAAGFRTELVQGSTAADHAAFDRSGALAVTVNEYDTAAYHTYGDLPSGLSAAELDAVADAVLGLLATLASE
ncbi:MAG: M28 family peptidase [Spirochaetales bacterium]|nr:M28 family peptidase [Spirochaetales bacterium]